MAQHVGQIMLWICWYFRFSYLGPNFTGHILQSDWSRWRWASCIWGGQKLLQGLFRHWRFQVGKDLQGRIPSNDSGNISIKHQILAFGLIQRKINIYQLYHYEIYYVSRMETIVSPRQTTTSFLPTFFSERIYTDQENTYLEYLITGKLMRNSLSNTTRTTKNRNIYKLQPFFSDPTS